MKYIKPAITSELAFSLEGNRDGIMKQRTFGHLTVDVTKLLANAYLHFEQTLSDISFEIVVVHVINKSLWLHTH